MIDFALTETQKMLRTTAHRFALEQIRPVATEVDRNPNPDNFPWPLYQKASELGFTKMLVPEKYGGLGMGLLDLVIAIEELGWGDAGVANSIGTTAYCVLPLATAGTEYQKENFLRPFMEDTTGRMMMAAPGTGPEGGSEMFCTEPGTDIGQKATAVKDGKYWVLNGTKSWSSNAGIACLYMIVARTNPDAPSISGCTMFLVPGDSPGLSFGRVENKMGRRAQRNQEIFLENVRVPEEYVFGKVNGLLTSNLETRPMFPKAGHLYQAASTIGLARAAYEEALKYANERIIWGKPIREHQLIGKKLVDMRLKIEAMRAFTWKLAWAIEHKEQPELSDGLSYLGGEAAKYFATDQIVDLVRDAMQIFGAIGYTRDLSIEKWMRDAIGLSICGTTNEVHSIFLSKKL